MLSPEELAREKIDALLKQCAVANNVNVNHDVHKIDTEIRKGGSRVEKAFYVDKRDRLTPKVRREQLDEVCTITISDSLDASRKVLSGRIGN
jgi:hypothetical protein